MEYWLLQLSSANTIVLWLEIWVIDVDVYYMSLADVSDTIFWTSDAAFYMFSLNFLKPRAPQLLEVSKKNILIYCILTFIQLWAKLFLYVRISTYWFKKKQAYWSKWKTHCTCWSIFTLQDKTSWYSLQGINIYILLHVSVIKSGNWARFPSNSIKSLNDYFSSQILVSKGKKELEDQKKNNCSPPLR